MLRRRAPFPPQEGRASDVWLVRFRLTSQPRVIFNLVFADYGEAMHAYRVLARKVVGSVTIRWRG